MLIFSLMGKMKLGFYLFLVKKYFYRFVKIFLKSDGRFFWLVYYSKWFIIFNYIKFLFGNIMYMYLFLIIKNKYM